MFTLLASLQVSVHPKINHITENVIQCSKGGVTIQLLQTQDRLQVCANEYCVEIDQPYENVRVQFPAEVTIHFYHVMVKTLLGNSTQTFHWACSPSPFCEQITCTSDHFRNVGHVCLAFHGARKLCRCCTNIGSRLFISQKLCFSQRHFQRRHSNEYVPLVEVNSDSNRKRRTSTFTWLLAISTIAQTAEGCQQVALVQSYINQCSSMAHNCTSTTTVNAKFNSMQSELCLQVTHDTLQVQLMKITVEEVVLRCQKETLYFTQITETRVQSRKRCPHMGTCRGPKSASISTDSLVEELDVANNFAGLTYCSESCGGWGCFCGFPSSGCLFYRI
ncbi:hypothetical protein COOONC_00525 [Cooperia oncophora]